ncbi:glycoside hydrolase family 92 protein [Teratosphaeria destructans]|uniref:Glycoside hydrolase family 92 protein n=1 Tax=Teratosphaeria destructans TaxID=418781 RepID=A0A9W7SWJ8_9PEZI|nr:glycoside hydrolase family 92 protein [Teratosphaeria destructans]
MAPSSSPIVRLAGVCLLPVATARLADYVDPLIGTVGSTPGSAIAGGNSFPGASLPWGMAKPGIDTSYIGLPNGTAVDCNAGYTPLGNVTAISMTHVSGSGGTPTYGLIAQMPIRGDLAEINLADNTTYWQNRSLQDETASVGLFKTVLLNGVGVELGASNHSGIMRYTFPLSPSEDHSYAAPGPVDHLAGAGHDDAHVLVDLTHVLPAYKSQAYSQRFLNGAIRIETGANAQPSYSGFASYTGGWSQAQSHTLHFCGNFSVDGMIPTSDYTIQNAGHRVMGAGTFTWPYDPLQRPSSKPALRSFTDVKTYAGSGMGIGAVFSWTPDGRNASGGVIESRVGISYISAAQACASVAHELPSSIAFEQVVEQAKSEWEEKILSTIEIGEDGSPSSSNDTLKRMLYTALYQTGLMPTDKTGENPYWETSDAAPYYDDHYTLWDTYRTLLPLYHLLYTTTYSRVIKGLISIFSNEGFLPAGRIANWNGRVQGGTHADMVLADAFVKDGGELDPSIDWQEAYQAVLNDANNPPEHNEDSVAFDGANKEGRGALDDYLSLHYITRNHTRSISRGVEYAQNDFALYSIAQKLPHTPDTDLSSFRSRASWWQNQWSPDATTSLRLPPHLSNATSNTTFTGFPAPRNADGTFNYTAYDPLTCAPAAGPTTSTRPRPAPPSTPSTPTPRTDTPGNIDGGALPSWLIWTLLGLYPVSPQPVYLLGSPRFSAVTLRLFRGTPRETVLEVRAEGLSDERCWPQGVWLDGVALDRSWVTHEEVARGGRLVFVMGERPGDWDRGERPPSLSGWG